MARALNKIVIIRMWGRKVGYKMLYSKVEDLLHLTSGYKIVDLENDYFMVKFDEGEDYFGIRFDLALKIFKKVQFGPKWAFSPIQPKTCHKCLI